MAVTVREEGRGLASTASSQSTTTPPASQQRPVDNRDEPSTSDDTLLKA